MRRSFAAAVFMVSLVAAGCGDDSTGPDDDNNGGNGGNAGITTEAEAVAVTGALFAEMSQAMANMQISGNSISGNGATMPNFTFSGNCSQGGSISGNGSINQSSSGIAYSLTYTPSNCKVQGSQAYTVNGNPNIRMNWSMPNNGGSMNYSVDGGIKWNGGSCALDYDMVLSQNGHGTIRGTMCGINVDADV